jgi:lipopolysaccharide exporter
MWVAASSIWMLGFGFIMNVALTRLLFPSDFGQYALAMFFAQLMRLQPKFGASYAFAQHPETSGEAIGTYFVTETAVAAASVALVAAASPLLMSFGYSITVAKVCIALSIVAFIESIGGMGIMLLDKELRFKETSLLRCIISPVSYVPAFWFALHGGGVWTIVIQSFAYNVLFALTVWIVVPVRLPHIMKIKWRPDPALARKFLKFGITVGFSGFAGILITQTDNFLIGTFVGTAALGLYDRAYRIAEWPGSLCNAVIARSVFFVYSRLQTDTDLLGKAVTMVIWAIISITLPIALGVFVVAPDLMLFLYGDRWISAAPLLRLLIIYAFLRPLWDNGVTFFIATGKPALTAKCTVLQAIVLIACGLPLALLWGATGVCLAVGLCFITGAVFLYTRMARDTSINLVSLFGGPALAGLLTMLCYFIIIHFTALSGASGLPFMVLKACSIAAIFLVFTVILQPSVTRQRTRQVIRLLSGKEPS